MKKTYIEPKVDVIKVGVCSVICGSLPMGGKASENSVTSADSREFEWDDDF